MGTHNATRKQIKELVKFAEALGFFEAGFTGTGHIKLRHPNGSQTTLSFSADAGARQRAQLRRLAAAEDRTQRR